MNFDRDGLILKGAAWLSGGSSVLAIVDQAAIVAFFGIVTAALLGILSVIRTIRREWADQDREQAAIEDERKAVLIRELEATIKHLKETIAYLKGELYEIRSRIVEGGSSISPYPPQPGPDETT